MSGHLVTAFRGQERLASGPLREVARVAWQAIKDGASSAVLVFDDATGRVIDLEMRGDERAMLAHLDATTRGPATSAATDVDTPALDQAPRTRGRPKLGVVAREITLLPRHWEWLATQPGGASVALRKLVEAARRTHADDDRAKASRDIAYRFMNAMAGDLSQFEEVIRALYRGDEARFRELIAEWPRDIAVYSAQLAFPVS
ncbi:DUF2239 family protein [Gemmatimonas groenlandica]|uniref:DUF2239 family protein n=1 Tax=Gemmatimonas groenlandica TaxID=2732249 RepID=A0A6M4IX28_9BACT|nr:DUF2239 family protein [Gemmatimonas groenlandica]QJR36741.1 DUF2239 family protein [Gemmatimonas groenlandica]